MNAKWLILGGQILGFALLLFGGHLAWLGFVPLAGGIIAGGLYFFRRPVSRVDLGPEAIQMILRSRNHGFLNHLQVVSGYAEMGQPVPTKYLERILKEAKGERELEAMPHADLVLALAWARQQAEAAGVEWVCRLEGKIEQGSAGATEQLADLLAREVARLAQRPDEGKLEVIVAGEGARITVRVGETIVDLSGN